MGTLISNYYDQKLLQSGIDSFSMLEYNEYVTFMAKQENMLVTDITKEFLLDYHKKIKIEEFNNKCDEEIMVGFVSETNGHTYRSNIDDQINFIGKYIAVKDDETVSNVFWKAEDVGEQIPHSRDEFLTIYHEGFKHKENLLYKLHTLRQQVKSCVTDSEIVAIKWE